MEVFRALLRTYTTTVQLCMTYTSARTHSRSLTNNKILCLETKLSTEVSTVYLSSGHTLFRSLHSLREVFGIILVSSSRQIMSIAKRGRPRTQNPDLAGVLWLSSNLMREPITMPV